MQLSPAAHAIAAASVTPPSNRPEPAVQRRARARTRRYLQGYATRGRQARFRIR